MRLLRLLVLLAVMLVAGLAGAGAAQATPDAVPSRAAAPCDREARVPLADRVAAADAVVIGQVDVVYPALSASTIQVDVTEVRKAPEGVTWGKQVPVRSPRSCKLEGVRRGADWVFMGTVDSQGRLVATAVGGSQKLTRAVQSRIEKLTATPPPAPAEPQLEMVADSEAPELTELALPGAVLVGIGLLTWLLGRVLGRRPKER